MPKAESQSLSDGWRERLAALEPALELGPLTWQTRLEAKILRFLLARYPDGRGVTSANAPRLFVSTLAFIASPKARPAPRQRMKLLRQISQINRAVWSAKKSPFERFYENLDRHLEAQHNQSREERQQRAQRQTQMKEHQRHWRSEYATRNDFNQRNGPRFQIAGRLLFLRFL